MDQRCVTCIDCWEDKRPSYVRPSSQPNDFFCTLNPKWLIVDERSHFCRQHSALRPQSKPFGEDRS